MKTLVDKVMEDEIINSPTVVTQIEKDLKVIEHINGLSQFELLELISRHLEIDNVEDIETMKIDAMRYQWLREQHWYNGVMCVVADPNNVKLGSYCPSGRLLDEMIDKHMVLGAPE